MGVKGRMAERIVKYKVGDRITLTGDLSKLYYGIIKEVLSIWDDSDYLIKWYDRNNDNRVTETKMDENSIVLEVIPVPDQYEDWEG